MGPRIVVISLLFAGLAGASPLAAEPELPLKFLTTPALGDASPGNPPNTYEAALVNTGRRAWAWIGFCDSTGNCVVPQGIDGCAGLVLDLGEGCSARFTPEVAGYHYARMVLIPAVKSGAPVDGRGSLQAAGAVDIRGAVSTE
jgi:hypothetical protein